MKRCAIYTRKSGDERHGAQFTSLQNQREYSSAYILSQTGEGWLELATPYDDAGYSGGTLSRPALTQLRADVAAGLIDNVVVYKIDRLSRSLRDFANLVAEFEARGVSFVSVTQAFDTASSMGRLTLNVLLSFAQFEREITGERLRDKFAASRAKGLWTCRRPLGYRVVESRLVIDPAEADFVRLLYKRYLRVGSIRLLTRELTSAGYLNHRGGPLGAHYVSYALINPLYLGHLTYHGQVIPDTHESIVTQRDWDRVKAAMARSARRRRGLIRLPQFGMLKGLFFARTGHAMILVFTTTRRGIKYRYYVASLANRFGAPGCPVSRFRADAVDAAVFEAIHALVRPHSSIKGESMPMDQRAGLIRRVIERIDVKLDGFDIKLKVGGNVVLPLLPEFSPKRGRRVLRSLS